MEMKCDHPIVKVKRYLCEAEVPLSLDVAKHFCCKLKHLTSTLVLQTLALVLRTLWAHYLKAKKDIATYMY